jgi:hypothetical protein
MHVASSLLERALRKAPGALRVKLSAERQPRCVFLDRLEGDHYLAALSTMSGVFV